MNKPYLYAGLGLLALTAVIGSCGIPVTIKTGSLYPDSDPENIGCYTSGTTGLLVTDQTWGVAIIEDKRKSLVEDNRERRVAVTWPIGWTGRRSWLGVEVINKNGEVVARTGTHVNLLGGYWRVDHSFLTCGPDWLFR